LLGICSFKASKSYNPKNFLTNSRKIIKLTDQSVNKMEL
jgi:hypothetical protein